MFRHLDKVRSNERKASDASWNGQKYQRNRHHSGRFMCMAGMFGTWLPEECDDEKPGHVISSQKCDRRDGEKCWNIPASRGENSVFTPESREGRTSDQGEGADEKGPEGDRHFRSETAHMPDILFV